ncbi:uncharacterized protein [Diabrotica undecimpunctata]|uniref:uncharacterized protein n=1 Tax=Diabrotica undecimpunctata TaxID=50387 RepID=UPI003B636427
MHIFPKDRALYDIWINKIGREDLKVKPMDRVRKSYRICTIHFGPEARYVGSRYKSTLKCDAIPSLFPNTACRREASSAKVYKSPAENSRTEQRESRETEQVSIVMPSTSQSICAEILPLRSTSTPERKIETEYGMCTPTKVSSLNKSTSILSYISVKRTAELTPKAKKMYRIASSLRRTAKKLNFLCKLV